LFSPHNCSWSSITCTQPRTPGRAHADSARNTQRRGTKRRQEATNAYCQSRQSGKHHAANHPSQTKHGSTSAMRAAARATKSACRHLCARQARKPACKRDRFQHVAIVHAGASTCQFQHFTTYHFERAMALPQHRRPFHGQPVMPRTLLPNFFLTSQRWTIRRPAAMRGEHISIHMPTQRKHTRAVYRISSHTAGSGLPPGHCTAGPSAKVSGDAAALLGGARAARGRLITACRRRCQTRARSRT